MAPTEARGGARLARVTRPYQYAVRKTMPTAKAKPAARAAASIHTEEQKEEVKTARAVIKRYKAVLGGGDVSARLGMTLGEAQAAMDRWRARVDASK